MQYPYLLVPHSDKIKVNPSSPLRERISHSDYGHVVTYGPACRRFNRAVRDEAVMMITGDEPYTALWLTNPEADINPQPHVLGSLELLGIGGVKETEFDGNSTLWSFSSGVRLRCVLTPSGFAGVISTDKKTYVRAQFGQMRLIAEHFRSTYIEPNEGFLPTSAALRPDGHSALITCTDKDSPVRETCVFTAFDCMGAYVSGPIAAFDYVLEPGREYRFAAVCLEKGTVPATAADVDAAIAASDKKKLGRLDACRAETPDTLLDGGFIHAVLNHYYDHVGEAWYEGCHWWNTYFTDNYQISCAIALGNYELARRALLFFASHPDGYQPILSDGSQPAPERQPGETCRPMNYDGAPYYIYQLHEYTEATGDLSVFRQVSAWLFDMLTAFEQVQYRDGHWGFHYGCNPFLYQSDMLALPNESSSVGLFMAGMYRRLAVLCRLCGGYEDKAAEFTAKTEKTEKCCLNDLWDTERGCFFSHRDFEGKTHRGYYYTDFVFPALYTDLPSETTDSCLDACRCELMYTAENGQTLMRVGNLKPSGFGQDNVMPVQMSEAAAAYLANCDSETAVQLLDGVALGATVFTEAPGNFPERMGPDGKGEGDYLFGNPCAVYAYRYIRSLFGLYAADMGKTLCVSPAFPRAWEKASIALPVGEMSYEGSAGCFTYRLKPDARFSSLRFSIALPLCEKIKITANGKSVEDFRVKRFACGVRAEFSLPAAETVVCAEVEGVTERIFRPVSFPETPLPYVLDPSDGCSLRGSVPLSLGVLPDRKTFARSGWRRDDNYEIRLKTENSLFRTPWSDFRVQPVPDTADSIFFRLVAKGTSRFEARLPEFFPKETAVYAVSVNRKVSAVLPLFVSETEARLTDSTVGSVTLRYSDGTQERTPLINGKTLTPLIKVYGDRLLTLPLANAEGSCEDSICVLPLRADPTRVLAELLFEIDTVDAFLNIAAVNVVPAD